MKFTGRLLFCLAACVSAEGVGEEWDADPSGETLFLVPTAYTPPQGSVSVRAIQVFLISVGFSPTSTTQVSGGFLFPLFPQIQMYTFGVKQQLLRVSGTALAVGASVIVPTGRWVDDEGPITKAGAVVSHRLRIRGYDDAVGLHAAAGYLGKERKNLFVSAAGGEVRLTSFAKVLAEASLLNGNPGLTSGGIRLHVEGFALDVLALGGLGEASLWPMVVLTFRF